MELGQYKRLQKQTLQRSRKLREHQLQAGSKVTPPFEPTEPVRTFWAPSWEDAVRIFEQERAAATKET